MPAMETDPLRRQLLLGLGAAALMPLGACGSAQADTRVLLSSFRDAAGRYVLCALRASGETLWRRVVADRAHDMVANLTNDQAIFFGRRPGHHCWMLSLRDGALRHELPAPARTHFNGHGAVSADGRRLFTTETSYEPTAHGQIGIWDTASGRRIGAWNSGGLDPHQCLLSVDGRSLLVANGGLLTEPGSERAKLNKDTMQPNLSWLDIQTGQVLRSERLPNHQLSIRHVANLPGGRVGVALQYEGPSTDDVPLAAIAGAQSGLTTLAAPATDWRAWNQYAESVGVDLSGRYMAVTGPRGSVFGVWDAQHGKPLEQRRFADVSALVPAERSFIVTSGLGMIARWRPGRDLDVRLADSGIAWDNHAEITGLSS